MDEKEKYLEKDDDYPEYSTEIEDMLLNIAWKDYDYCFDDKKVAENKVSIIIAVNSVFIGLIVTASETLNPYLLPLDYIFLFGSIFLALFALKFRNYQFIRASSIWSEILKNHDEDIPYRAKRSLFKTIDNITEKNRENYSEIVKYTTFSLYSFLIGVILVIISIVYPQLRINILF